MDSASSIRLKTGGLYTQAGNFLSHRPAHSPHRPAGTSGQSSVRPFRVVQVAVQSTVVPHRFWIRAWLDAGNV